MRDVLPIPAVLSLLRYQGPMLRTWGKVYARSKLPLPPKTENPAQFRPLLTVIDAPADVLVDAYVDWCQASAAYYAHHLPPHLFCHWSLPLVLEVLGQSRYDVATVINQGVQMRQLKPLPRGQALVVQVELDSLSESQGRANVAVKITTGTQDHPCLVEAVLYFSFILSKESARIVANPYKPPQGSQWQSAGTWQADEGDGLQFALLTGDFNPIHWLESAGRKSPFGQTVLQGFGIFARTFERLNQQQNIREFSVHFQRPVMMPSGELRVEYTQSSDTDYFLRLVDAQNRARITGRFVTDFVDIAMQ